VGVRSWSRPRSGRATSSIRRPSSAAWLGAGADQEVMTSFYRPDITAARMDLVAKQSLRAVRARSERHRRCRHLRRLYGDRPLAARVLRLLQAREAKDFIKNGNLKSAAGCRATRTAGN